MLLVLRIMNVQNDMILFTLNTISHGFAALSFSKEAHTNENVFLTYTFYKLANIKLSLNNHR